MILLSIYLYYTISKQNKINNDMYIIIIIIIILAHLFILLFIFIYLFIYLFFV
jgi:hypothetical protein